MVSVRLEVMVLVLFKFMHSLDCWKRDSHQRPSFKGILDRLSNVTTEFLSTPPETFQSIRMNWKEEVQRKFLEFKDKELVSLLLPVMCCS